MLLGEAALLRAPDGGVMAGQLDQLEALSRKPHITVRILPVRVLHAGLNCGSRFVLLTFPADRWGNADPAIAYSEDLTGAAYLDKPDEIRTYEQVWDAMRGAALTPGDSRQLITTYRKEHQP